MGVLVVHPQAVPTPAADHQACQQRCPLAHRPQRRGPEAIGLEPCDIALILLPRQVGGTAVRQQRMPVGAGHDHPATLGTLGLGAAPIHLPPPVDVGAGVERMLQEILQGRSIGPTPDQLPFAGSLAHPHAESDVVARQIAQESAQRPQLLELGKDVPDHGLHLFVGVELDGSVRIPDIATGQRKGERPASGFTQAALVEPLFQEMQLRFTHGALESQ